MDYARTRALARISSTGHHESKSKNVSVQAAHQYRLLCHPTRIGAVHMQVSLVVNAEQTEVTDISVEVRRYPERRACCPR